MGEIGETASGDAADGDDELEIGRRRPELPLAVCGESIGRRRADGFGSGAGGMWKCPDDIRIAAKASMGGSAKPCEYDLCPKLLDDADAAALEP
jgi:hypothetical protein